MDMGAVGGLKNIKDAISVARHVLQNTKHSFLVGSGATDFAIQIGFESESLTTNYSKNLWKTWKNDSCQPNFWKVLYCDNFDRLYPTEKMLPERRTRSRKQLRALFPHK